MANHSSNFKILAQVEVDASTIQSQLNDAAKKAKINVKNNGLDIGKQVGLNFQEANMIMRQSVSIIENMVSKVYDLDSAMTEFKKVSDLDGSALDDYVNKLAEIGSTVGRTGSEMVEAATMFRKNSFNDQDSATLAGIAAKWNLADRMA